MLLPHKILLVRLYLSVMHLLIDFLNKIIIQLKEWHSLNQTNKARLLPCLVSLTILVCQASPDAFLKFGIL